jgi:adenylylsulfate kinase-like enzyme
MVILVTGKAGAGKSTYAARLAEELKADGISVRVIDGDEERKLYENWDFTDAGRYRHLIEMAKLASLSETRGLTVIVAAIAPKASWRREMMAMWSNSKIVYIPGGELWEGTEYERPGMGEL